jgi:hypothetical protein
MNLPNEIKATFTRNIVLGVGTLRVFKDGVLFITFTQDDLTVTDNYFTIDITNLFSDNGNYYILFDEGLITSIFGEHYSITNPDVWKFTILDGEFDSDDFSNEFLID